jgi:hypothetical protein
VRKLLRVLFCGEVCLSLSTNNIVEWRGIAATHALNSTVFGFLRPTMADRTPIFGTKAAKSQIGYIENGGAFDLSGTRRCNYSAATGNLSDPVTERLVGYVSFDGNFVVPSRIAAELFEQPGDSEASIPSSTAEGEYVEEYVTKSAEGEHAEEHVTKSAESDQNEYATMSNRPPALDEPMDAFLERVKEMIENSKKETS